MSSLIVPCHAVFSWYPLEACLFLNKKEEAVSLGERESEWEELGAVEGVRLDILYEKWTIKEKRKREMHKVDNPRHEAAFDANSVTEQRLSRDAG